MLAAARRLAGTVNAVGRTARPTVRRQHSYLFMTLESWYWGCFKGWCSNVSFPKINLRFMCRTYWIISVCLVKKRRFEEASLDLTRSDVRRAGVCGGGSETHGCGEPKPANAVKGRAGGPTGGVAMEDAVGGEQGAADQAPMVRAHLPVCRPMSCMPGYFDVINTHTVGSLTIPRASIKWV